MQDNETFWAWVKLALAWLGTVIGTVIESVTLSKAVLFATLVLTCMQGYVLWRDKIKRKEVSCETDAR
ncbi:hypothetical protein [Cupriavidus metallidurans]|uniref:hypothetical protein n=1 Tax=Cupriavidus metallidurans TaxID=119219 RepID=UPI0016483FA4|nr:hypothetical protein [Cupriavidus metallidurans]